MTPNRHDKLLAVLVTSACLVACAAQAQNPAAAPLDDSLLVHRFTLPHKQSWGRIAVLLVPAQWRVGRIDGPPATEAQLRAVIGHLGGIEVGGRCAGWVEGQTAYPCSFAVREIDFAGAVMERHFTIASDCASADEGPAQAPMRSQPPQTGASTSRMQGALRFVGVRAPLAYLGDKSQAFGGRLQFEIRAVSNPLLPSQFDRSSGMVILHSGQRSSRI